MTARLKPYFKVKESEVPWLGEVPAHWEVVPARAVFRPKQVKNAGMIESRVLSLSYGRIVVKDPEKLHGLVPQSFETYQIVEPGNIIVRTTDLQNDRTSLRIGQSKHRGIITSAYMCLEAKGGVSSQFGYQLLNTYDLLKIIYGFGSGLRQNLDFSDIKRMPVLVPPVLEQEAIVRFLDHADRQIRRFISTKLKLIKLLEEQKRTIVHQAVTRGLDPNVRLKPSGVPWLGLMPEHWTLRPNRALVRRRKTLVGPRFSEYPLLSLTKEGVIVRDVESGKGKFSVDMSTFQEVQTGDLVFCLFDVPETPRTVGLSPFDGMITGAYTIFECSDPVLAAFLDLFYRAMDDRKLLSPLYSGLRNTIPASRLMGAMTPVPPSKEQASIIQYVNDATGTISSAVRRARHEISLLREYRARLVADVVTGKLDVRDAVATLPDEVEELSAPLDGEVEDVLSEAVEDDHEPEPEVVEA